MVTGCRWGLWRCLAAGAELPASALSVRAGRAFLEVAAPEDEDDIQLTSGAGILSPKP